MISIWIRGYDRAYYEWHICTCFTLNFNIIQGYVGGFVLILLALFIFNLQPAIVNANLGILNECNRISIYNGNEYRKEQESFIR